MLRRIFSRKSIGIVLLAGLVVLFVSALIGVGVYLFKNADWENAGSIFRPQNCGSSTIIVKGYVVNKQGIPIAGAEVHAFNQGSYSLPAFDVIASSNTFGYFETPSVPSFTCTLFNVEISAPGYQDQVLAFYPPGAQQPGELPERLVISLRANDSP